MKTTTDGRRFRISSTRRDFLRTIGIAATSVSLPPILTASLRRLENPVRIGMIADLHQDVMHDGEKRLDAFLKEMAETRPDAIMQLGDFAYPNKKNRSVIGKFNKAHQHSLHVIGNHDTDSGHTQKQCFDVWGMTGRYYSYDVGGLKFLVLDGNDKGSPTHKGGYPSFVGKEQIDWLKEQIRKLDGPIVVVSHQPLAGSSAVDNAKEIQEILSKHSEKVVIAINGHTHIDDLLRIGKVSYLHVNSASYLWVGRSHRHHSYAEYTHSKFPSIEYTCPYRDSLFTTLTFDPKGGTISVKGRKSEWVGKSPAELGVDKNPELTIGEEVAPRIRSRRIERAR